MFQSLGYNQTTQPIASTETQIQTTQDSEWTKTSPSNTVVNIGSTELERNCGLKVDNLKSTILEEKWNRQ